MTGTALTARSRRNSSRPPMPGSMRSKMIKSGSRWDKACQGLGPVDEDAHGIAGRRQVTGDHVVDRRVVVDHRDGAAGHRGRAVGRRADVAAGLERRHGCLNRPGPLEGGFEPPRRAG